MPLARKITLVLLFLLAPLQATADQKLEEAEAAVATFVAAVASGDGAALAAVLEPEFQIVRTDGSGYDRDGYLRRSAPTVRILGTPLVENLVASGEGDILVARYMLNVQETIDGVAIEALAPRLTVFRREVDRWLVVAHANFALLVK
jgi:ketosteroid isomerase-like protein